MFIGRRHPRSPTDNDNCIFLYLYEMETFVGFHLLKARWNPKEKLGVKTREREGSSSRLNGQARARVMN